MGRRESFWEGWMGLRRVEVKVTGARVFAKEAIATFRPNAIWFLFVVSLFCLTGSDFYGLL